jgi:hypothetical protein
MVRSVPVVRLWAGAANGPLSARSFRGVRSRPSARRAYSTRSSRRSPRGSAWQTNGSRDTVFYLTLLCHRSGDHCEWLTYSASGQPKSNWARKARSRTGLTTPCARRSRPGAGWRRPGGGRGDGRPAATPGGRDGGHLPAASEPGPRPQTRPYERGWAVSGRLRSRLDRLERAAGAHSDSGGPHYAVVCHDGDGRVRRLLVSGPSFGSWGVSPDSPLVGLVAVKRLGPGLDWDDLCGAGVPGASGAFPSSGRREPPFCAGEGSPRRTAGPAAQGRRTFIGQSTVTSLRISKAVRRSTKVYVGKRFHSFLPAACPSPCP